MTNIIVNLLTMCTYIHLLKKHLYTLYIYNLICCLQYIILDHIIPYDHAQKIYFYILNSTTGKSMSIFEKLII